MKDLLINLYKAFKEINPEEDVIGGVWELAGKILLEGKELSEIKFNLENEWENYKSEVELKSLLLAAELDDEDIVFGNGSWLYKYLSWF